MTTLETERLILRSFRESDLNDFHEYARNPHVGLNAGWPPHSSIEDSSIILGTFIAEDEIWAIESKQNHKVIGSLGLHNDPLRSTDDVKMLGYVLSEDYWGRGIIAEALKAVISYVFDHLDINLLSVRHYTFNYQSKRVIEKCGFTYEGTLRHAAKVYNGSVYDVACYSMMKEDWASR